DGGSYTIWDTVFQKGNSPQNPYAVNWFATNDAIVDIGVNWPVNQLTLEDCTIACMGIQGNYYDPSTAINYCTRTINGVNAALTLTNNSIYLAADAVKLSYTGGGSGIANLTETGTTLLTAPPAFSFTEPGTAVPPAARPTWFYSVGSDAGEFSNFDGVQIDPGIDDIRISHTASPGDHVCMCAAY